MRVSKREECPACKSSVTTDWGARNGFRIVNCRGCKTVYASTLADAVEGQDYDGYYSEANLEVPLFVKQRIVEIVRGFVSFRQGNRLLDIGFGAGTIMETAVEEGWETFGTEVSKPAVEHARSLGFSAFYGPLREAAYPDNHFDIITASEILEHLTKPEEDLNEIFRILRPGGLFWATTPSSTGLSARLLGLDWSVLSPPEHTQLYSRRGADLMLRRAGFKTVRIAAHGLNPMEIVNHYRKKAVVEDGFDRVRASYSLNEQMMRSGPRKQLKGLLNGLLSLVHLGDSLKIFAIK